MTKAQNTSAVSPSRSRTLLWTASAATFAAILTHFYLASKHYALKFGEVNTQSLCNINATFNCEAVSASRFAEFLGVPMAVWGALANIVLLILIALYPITEETKKPAARRNLLLVAGAIAATSLVMGGISLVALSAYCPFCILTYVLSFVGFGTLWAGLPRPASSATSALSNAGPKAGDFSPLVIAVVIAFIAGFISNDQIKKSYGFQNVDAFVQQQMEEWTQSPERKFETLEPLAFGAPREKAKMIITEFADFRCIHCKHAAPALHAFASSRPDVRLEFQAWPLDGECNTSIPNANGASCLLARAVYCAEKTKGRGWNAHDYVFEHQEEYGSVDAVKSRLTQIAESAGMTAQEMETCAQSPETKTTVEKQAAVGSGLNLRGTPTIFVNGKLLPGGQSVPVLQEAYKRLAK